jgi:antirestriction protein ArdC
VKKGEKASLVVFWRWYETKDQKTGEPLRVPVLRHFNVFNAEQVEGVKVPDAVPFEPLEFTPIEEAERTVSGYADGPGVEHGGSQAYYLPVKDHVRMPERERFASVVR